MAPPYSRHAPIRAFPSKKAHKCLKPVLNATHVQPKRAQQTAATVYQLRKLPKATIKSQKNSASRIGVWLSYKKARGISQTDLVTMADLEDFVYTLLEGEYVSLSLYLGSVFDYELSKLRLFSPTNNLQAENELLRRKTTQAAFEFPPSKAGILNAATFYKLSRRLKLKTIAATILGLRIDTTEEILPEDLIWDPRWHGYYVKCRKDKVFKTRRLPALLTCCCPTLGQKDGILCPVCEGVAPSLFPITRDDIELIACALGDRVSGHSPRRTAAMIAISTPGLIYIPVYILNRHFGWRDKSDMVCRYTADFHNISIEDLPPLRSAWARKIEAAIEFGFLGLFVPEPEPEVARKIIHDDADKQIGLYLQSSGYKTTNPTELARISNKFRQKAHITTGPLKQATVRQARHEATDPIILDQQSQSSQHLRPLEAPKRRGRPPKDKTQPIQNQ